MSNIMAPVGIMIPVLHPADTPDNPQGVGSTRMTGCMAGTAQPAMGHAVLTGYFPPGTGITGNFSYIRCKEVLTHGT